MLLPAARRRGDVLACVMHDDSCGCLLLPVFFSVPVALPLEHRAVARFRQSEYDVPFQLFPCASACVLLRACAVSAGGGGVGLERVVMLLFGLKNIRKAPCSRETLSMRSLNGSCWLGCGFIPRQLAYVKNNECEIQCCCVFYT